MNYKQQATAFELVASIASRTGLATAYDEFGSDPVVLVGTPAVGGTNSASIRILDQRAGESQGWQTIIPGQAQSVRTTGVAQILVEPTGPAGVAPVAATGTFTLDTVAAGVVVTIAGVALTEGVDWNGTGLDNDVAATNLQNAINGNPALAALMTATSVAGTIPATDPAVVTVTADFPGTWANSLATTSSGASVVAGGATMAGGVDGDSGGGIFLNPTALINLVGECARRGVKVELWYTADAGSRPMFANFGTAVLQGEFENDAYWPLQSRV